MSEPIAAVAVFVKTLGLSPIKTRLAGTIDQLAADEFYRLSVAAVGATLGAVTKLNRAAAYWAVAEAAGRTDRLWQQFECVDQGDGALGDRLGRVFQRLRRQYASVVLIGADSPQVTPAVLQQSLDVLTDERTSGEHVLGRCHDGGFYLVGSNVHLPSQVWQTVPYSSANAADQLAERLMPLGRVNQLPMLVDVDRADDLATLADELAAIDQPSRQQLAILDWITERGWRRC